MPDSILVVEYEPRYIERVRQALSGYSQPNFAKDGEEALKLLESGSARLIVLSSIIPKISTAELIRKIRVMPKHQLTPILITVSGYNGRSPKADAVKLGATDILPKPYSEGEFLNKVRQLVDSPDSLAPEATIQIPKMSPSDLAAPEPTVVVQKISPQDLAPEPTVVVPKMSAEELAAAGKVSSDDIFGDMVDESAARKTPPRQSKSSAELDKLLETTLSGLQPTPRRPAAPKAEAKKASSELDKLLETTLSGLDVPRPRTSSDRPAPTPPEAPRPAPQPQAAPKPETPAVPEHTEQMAIPTAEELEAERRRAEASQLPPPPASAEGSISISSPVLPERGDAAEEDEAEDGIRFGQYVLLEKIATGGMAEVWKARMRGVEGFQKTVAIKKILPHMSDNEEFLTMFVDEAKLAAQLSHNNIIHIYELGKIADSYFIAMEYIDGEDLKSIIKQGQETMQPITVELAVFVASKIASALDYAHRKKGFDEKELGLVHRDVSPQNVLISYEGDIKLCDFGIAKAASKASHTMAGALKGKLQYMSPEQAWGRHIDRRSDIFALATVLFEMLTGQKLFVGESEISVLEQVREAKVKAPSTVNDEVPPEVDQIVLKALAKDPEKRYQTAGEMARDLEQVLYTFRPTPASADLAIHMHRLFVEVPPIVQSMQLPEEPSGAEPESFSSEPVALMPPEPAPAPEPEPEPEPIPSPVPPEPVPQPEAVAADVPVYADLDEEKKFPVVPVGIAAVVLIAAIGVGAFLMKGGSSGTAPQSAQAIPSPVAATPEAAGTVDELPTDTAAEDLVDPEAPVTDTALDQALIDQEVARRLEAERARLDAQRQQDLKRAEDAAKPEPAATKPPAQPERPAETATTSTQGEAPPPVTTSEPPPVVTPPPVTTPKPPEQPAAKVVKEGDLVAVGTPGLVAPSLVNFNKPVYPPVAKMQRVEGLVIVQVLVSEAGEVLEVKVLRGVNKDVGINEAAIDAMKRSTFKPATLNGVKVKSYYTRTIPFTL